MQARKHYRQKLLKPSTCPLRTMWMMPAAPLAAVSSPPPPICPHALRGWQGLALSS
jgi:hypothetical protein